MASPVINKYCVRISVRDQHDQQICKGSGTIIKRSNEYFVLTARHCLRTASDKNAPLVAIGQIRVETQERFNSPFQQIGIQGIVQDNIEQDWALLKIDQPPFSDSMGDIHLGENLRTGELLFFRGYQGINYSQPRSFDAKIIDTSDHELMISLHESSFNQGGNLGADMARGLSGSGVFLLRNDKIYLVGLLKSVIGEIALNDDIKCAAITGCKGFVTATTHDLESAENIPWSEDKRKLNEIFIRRMFNALREYKPAIAHVGKSADANPDLWDVELFRGRAQKAVADNYLSVLGIQIIRLTSISVKDKHQQQTQKEFLERVITAAKRSVQLLSYVFISKLWDCRYKKDWLLDPNKQDLLKRFFDNVEELAVTDYFKVMAMLVELYINDQELESPVEELEELHIKCQPGTYFDQAFQKLQQIGNKIRHSNFTLTDCFDAELELAVIMESLVFLSRYKMVSIISAQYQQVRNMKGNYQHCYIELVNSDKQVSKEDEKLNYLPDPACTDAVIFYRDTYDKGVNLTPFLIDLSTLDSEEACQVYFYISRDPFNTDRLIYSTTAAETDRVIELEFKNIPAEPPGVLAVLTNKKDKTDKIQLRKDIMHKLFMEARKEIMSIIKN